MTDPLLQMQWDAALIKAWHDNTYMNYLWPSFMAKHHIGLEELLSIKRTPRHGRQFKKPVRAFVAHSLPALSHWLWETTQTTAEVVLRLGDSNMDTVSGSSANSSARELVSEDREQRKAYIVHQQRGHRRSDWSVCKA